MNDDHLLAIELHEKECNGEAFKERQREDAMIIKWIIGITLFVIIAITMLVFCACETLNH